jgi:hypothetical protein
MLPHAQFSVRELTRAVNGLTANRSGIETISISAVKSVQCQNAGAVGSATDL